MNMEYLIRFIQTHETFRQPEIDALAELHGIELEWLDYSHDVGLDACMTEHRARTGYVYTEYLTNRLRLLKCCMV